MNPEPKTAAVKAFFVGLIAFIITCTALWSLNKGRKSEPNSNFAGKRIETVGNKISIYLTPEEEQCRKAGTLSIELITIPDLAEPFVKK